MAVAAIREGVRTLKSPEPNVHFEDVGGRILVADSLTHFSDGVTGRDVVMGASFAGIPTASYPLERGVRAWIAHEAGPGLAKAGIEGLAFAEQHGVPAAAIATMSAGLSDGPSLLSGTIAHANGAATAAGVRLGMTGEAAAKALLDAPEGRQVDTADAFSRRIVRVVGDADAGIYAVWSMGLLKNCRPKDVFCVASHAGLVMGDYAAPIRPKGLIANDAGVGLDRSGIAGLRRLDEIGVAAATVATDTARIGHPLSTYHDGRISFANERARDAGVAVGRAASEAAKRMFDRE